jgi:hypothetical protein
MNRLHHELFLLRLIEDCGNPPLLTLWKYIGLKVRGSFYGSPHKITWPTRP